MNARHPHTLRPSMTADALALHRGVLQRVDTAQVPAGYGGAAGHCRTAPASTAPTRTAQPQGCTQDCGQGDWCTCADGLCLEACSAFAEPDDADASHEFKRWHVVAVLVVYLLFLACVFRAAWLAARLT